MSMAVQVAGAHRVRALYPLLCAGMALVDAVTCRACALYALLCAQAWRLLTPLRAGYALCMHNCTQRQGACCRCRAQGMRFACTIVHKGRALADAVARRVRALHAILYAKAGRLRTPLLAGYALCMHYYTQRHGACCRCRAPRMRFVSTLARRHGDC